MSSLENKIVEILREFESIKAIHIAKKLGLTKKQVNSILYSGQNIKFKRDDDFRWSLNRLGSINKRYKIQTILNNYDINKNRLYDIVELNGVKIDRNKPNSIIATSITKDQYLNIVSMIDDKRVTKTRGSKSNIGKITSINEKNLESFNIDQKLSISVNEHPWILIEELIVSKKIKSLHKKYKGYRLYEDMKGKYHLIGSFIIEFENKSSIYNRIQFQIEYYNGDIELKYFSKCKLSVKKYGSPKIEVIYNGDCSNFEIIPEIKHEIYSNGYVVINKEFHVESLSKIKNFILDEINKKSKKEIFQEKEANSNSIKPELKENEAIRNKGNEHNNKKTFHMIDFFKNLFKENKEVIDEKKIMSDLMANDKTDSKKKLNTDKYYNSSDHIKKLNEVQECITLTFRETSDPAKREEIFQSKLKKYEGKSIKEKREILIAKIISDVHNDIYSIKDINKIINVSDKKHVQEKTFKYLTSKSLEIEWEIDSYEQNLNKYKLLYESFLDDNLLTPSEENELNTFIVLNDLKKEDTDHIHKEIDQNKAKLDLSDLIYNEIEKVGKLSVEEILKNLIEKNHTLKIYDIKSTIKQHLTDKVIKDDDNFYKINNHENDDLIGEIKYQNIKYVFNKNKAGKFSDYISFNSNPSDRTCVIYINTEARNYKDINENLILDGITAFLISTESNSLISKFIQVKTSLINNKRLTKSIKTILN